MNNLHILLNQVAAEAVHNFALLLIGNFTVWIHVRWLTVSTFFDTRERGRNTAVFYVPREKLFPSCYY